MTSKAIRIAATIAVALGVSVTNAASEELAITIDTQRTTYTYWEVGDQIGHYIGSYNQGGTVTFPDGEVGTHTASGTYDYVHGKGTYLAYARYDFDDGSTIVEQRRGEGSLASDGTRLSKGYSNFIAGTGRYEGVTGNGLHECTSANNSAPITCKLRVYVRLP